MIKTKKFDNVILDKLYDEYEKDNQNNIIIEGLQFIASVTPYEFIFMDMKDFRLYRTEVGRKTDLCVEVRPMNKIITIYVPV